MDNICQDHISKEKTLHAMSSMSSAQIVSTSRAMHNKMPPALVRPLAFHSSTPVSYFGAVSPSTEPLSFSLSNNKVCEWKLKLKSSWKFLLFEFLIIRIKITNLLMLQSDFCKFNSFTHKMALEYRKNG